MSEEKKLQHLAIICDGNRTWAKALGKSPLEGHQEGAKAVIRLAEAASEMKLPVLTVWVMGIDNFQRSKEEVSWLMKLARIYLKKTRKDLMKNNIKLRYFGLRGAPAPADIVKLAEEIEEETKNNTGTVLNVGFNYGGRVELVEAFKKIKEKGLEITEENISNNLWTAGLPDPDLILRPGKQQRLSGFMPWQSEYSEFYFPEYYFPDMDGEKLKEAVDEFNKRFRKFGKI
ncbi:MAG: di-trans,poly-cis-decaprenylcistransferase [Rickettsiales bacterium]|jgi:undecaprenyl diphosphate synthase|nr:di-trans,poly-cis-decaprenylcistransferase [Rickettsiales bacterium]